VISQAQQIQINLTKEYQTIDGFGGFGAKKVWWSSPPFHDAQYLNTIIDDMGCNIIRTQLYYDFEPANDNNDPNVMDESKFRFGTTSDNGKQFAFLKDLDQRGVKIIASVWTPPSWMKDFSDPKTVPDECYNCWNCPKPWTYPIPENRKMCGGVLSANMYEEYAEYLVAYVKILKKQTNIDLYGISIQNEPLFANPFESAVLRPKPYADVLKVVGERFRKEGLTTKFFGPEHMGEYSWGLGGNEGYVNEMFTKTTIGKTYLDYFSVHGYLDGVANDFGSAEGWTKLYNAITVNNGKPLWMTETGNLVANTFDQGFKFATALHLALKFGHISGWVFWGLADNVVTPTSTLTHTGNAMKCFYKYVKLGYINVESNTTDKDILVTAYKKGKSLVVVAINNASSDKSVQLSTGSSLLPSEFSVYRYSANEPHVSLGKVSNNSFSLKAKSVTSIVYEDVATSTENAEESMLSNVMVYPTEVYNGEFYLETKDFANLTSIQLFNNNGVMVKDFSANIKSTINTLRVDGVQPGMYILKMNSNKSSKAKKLLIY
jgi:O-glycosyl hydrolase